VSEAVKRIAAAAAAPAPWRVANGGSIVDANGRPIAYFAGRLHFPTRLTGDAGGAEAWRAIGGKMAAAGELEAALAELIDYTADILSSPIFCAVQWGPDSGPNGPVLQRARAALGRARGDAARGDPARGDAALRG
jgi:hypothetical protein